MEFPIECPKCKSNNIKLVAVNYPNAYECQECKYGFVKGKQALIDE